MPTDDFIDILPIDSDTIDDARARIDADTNAGIDTEDPSYQDTTTGGFFYDLSQAPLLEIERLRDFAATEVPAAAILPLSYGDLLDAWGVALSVARKTSINATGNVTFVAPNGTSISNHTEVGVTQVEPEADEIVFATTAATPIGGVAALADPTGLVATGYVDGGVLGSGTYFYVITAVVNGTETNVSNEVSIVLSVPGRVSLSWPAVPGAEGYRVYRGPSSASETLIASNLQALEFNDTGFDVGIAAAPTANTTGGAWALPVAAVQDGPEGNVAANAIDLLLSPAAGVTAVSNAFSTRGGQDVETDESYRPRLLLEFRGPTGSGTIADYERWCLADPDVGFVTIDPLWSGPGTVRCVLLGLSGDPVTLEVVTRLQQDLDPVPGQGHGRAPIGAIVTVTTPSIIGIAVVGTVIFDAGYSLDGTSGTLAVRDQIDRAIIDYVDALKPGESVILNHVIARFFTAPGVHDVSGVTLNGTASDVLVSADGVAQIFSVTLS